MAIENPTRNIYGFQYHPEVAHTEGGMDMVKHFLLDIAKVTPDWSMSQVVEEQMRLIREQVGGHWVGCGPCLWGGLEGWGGVGVGGT